jgi:hypothetical protein
MPKAKRNIGQEILDGHPRKDGPFPAAVRRVAWSVRAYSPRMGAGSPGALGCRSNATADRREEPARTTRRRLGFPTVRLPISRTASTKPLTRVAPINSSRRLASAPRIWTKSYGSAIRT